MTIIDEHSIARITRATHANASALAPWLIYGMDAYEINTTERQAMFLAQVGHETGGLRWLSEIWGPTKQQLRYERDFNAPWPNSPEQAKLLAYAVNRLSYGLGNTEPGDGSLFRGHGLIQTTGRTNHAKVRDRLMERFAEVAEIEVPDFEANPELLSLPQWAALSACDYWDMRGLNALADAGDYERITRRINGGLNGYDDRVSRLADAREVLSA